MSVESTADFSGAIQILHYITLLPNYVFSLKSEKSRMMKKDVSYKNSKQGRHLG